MKNHLTDMVEVVLSKPENFLIVRETLTRMGVANKDRTRLTQTCHILCKRNKYYIVHFKELFMLDGKPSNLTDKDVSRRNSIINYLLDRKFFTLASGQEKVTPFLPHTKNSDDDFTIIPYSDRSKWELVPKYTIGSPSNRRKPDTPRGVVSGTESAE